MILHELITPQAVLSSLRAQSKKQALQELSEHAAVVADVPSREIFDALLHRERLGSTGVGNGIAIPHAKLVKAPRIFGIFARLERPLDYEALDGILVDLIFLLIAPESAGADHLKALARIARMLRDTSLTTKLRATRDPGALYAILMHEPASRAA